MLAMHDAVLAGIDLSSALSKDMDVKCVFVFGLRRAIQENAVAQVEADIKQFVHHVDPNARTVVQGVGSAGFIFFQTARHMDVFLAAWTKPAHISVCVHRLGVRQYSTEHYGSHVARSVACPDDAGAALPAIEVTQPSCEAGGSVAALQAMAHHESPAATRWRRTRCIQAGRPPDQD